MLRENEHSEWRTPQFFGLELSEKPAYRIEATRRGKDGLRLRVYVLYPLIDKPFIVDLPPDDISGDGRWQWAREITIDSFWFGDNNKIKIITLDLEAYQDGADKIVIEKARLKYAQYRLVIR